MTVESTRADYLKAADRYFDKPTPANLKARELAGSVHNGIIYLTSTKQTKDGLPTVEGANEWLARTKTEFGNAQKLMTPDKKTKVALAEQMVAGAEEILRRVSK